jgi:alpha-glucuronidase
MQGIWIYNITSEQIADEWIRMTFSNDHKIIEPIKKNNDGFKRTHC